MAITPRPSNRMRSRITSQGQVTVPKAVRQRLRLEPGDELEFEIEGDRAVVHPRHRRSILDFAGIAGDRSGFLPRTADQLDAMLDKERAARAARRLKQ